MVSRARGRGSLADATGEAAAARGGKGLYFSFYVAFFPRVANLTREQYNGLPFAFIGVQKGT
jgi:hypothetical protein